jgi:hypothetical protein
MHLFRLFDLNQEVSLCEIVTDDRSKIIAAPNHWFAVLSGAGINRLSCRPGHSITSTNAVVFGIVMKAMRIVECIQNR